MSVGTKCRNHTPGVVRQQVVAAQEACNKWDFEVVNGMWPPLLKQEVLSQHTGLLHDTHTWEDVEARSVQDNGCFVVTANCSTSLWSHSKCHVSAAGIIQVK